jgi:hypothetical protein
MRLGAQAATLNAVARDLFSLQKNCRYCGRTAAVTWDWDIHTCTREVCEALAFSEVTRRGRRLHQGDPAWPFVSALLTSLATYEHALELDLNAELITKNEYARLRETEREKTAEAIAEIRRDLPRPPLRLEPERARRRSGRPAGRPPRRRHRIAPQPAAAESRPDRPAVGTAAAA